MLSPQSMVELVNAPMPIWKPPYGAAPILIVVLRGLKIQGCRWLAQSGFTRSAAWADRAINSLPSLKLIRSAGEKTPKSENTKVVKINLVMAAPIFVQVRAILMRAVRKVNMHKYIQINVKYNIDLIYKNTISVREYAYLSKGDRFTLRLTAECP